MQVQMKSFPQTYNKYRYILATCLGLYGIFYLKHNLTQPEFECREKPNILIPKIVYKTRRAHHIYWEVSRIARGYVKTFSYYNFDKESVKIY
jgi:hypothetical protein